MMMNLDKWRDYFRTANSDIFQIIEHAIVVAASDCPYDFRLKRDRIAEVLFAVKARRCSGCDRIEVAVPGGGDECLDNNKSVEDKYKSEVEAGGGSKDTKESKANCRDDDDDDDDDVYVDVVNDDSDQEEHDRVVVKKNQLMSNYNDGCDLEAEALSDEIEEESQLYQEFLRIKKVLDNCDEESNSRLYDSLSMLQLMPLSVETLESTGIGKSVNALRKHQSKEIRSLARTLVMDWKVMVDSWRHAIAENVTESEKTSAVEEEEPGLPSPPLDEGAFFATPTSMELSQFFDGINDYGNPQTGEEFYNQQQNNQKPVVNRTEPRKPEQKRNGETTLKKQAPPRPNNRPLANVENGPSRSKPLTGESGPMRPKPAVKPRANVDVNGERPGTIQKKPMPPQEKLNRNNDSSVRMNLEAAKRKLQERYQEAENAKRQRTIQVVDIHDLPKQSFAPRNQHSRLGNHNRNWAKGRR